MKILQLFAIVIIVYYTSFVSENIWLNDIYIKMQWYVFNKAITKFK